MASKKDKAPLQPSKGNNMNDPKAKKSAKPKTAAEKETPPPAQPQEPKATKKVSAKKAANAATPAKETPAATDLVAPIKKAAQPEEPIKKATKKAATKKAATKENKSDTEAAPALSPVKES